MPIYEYHCEPCDHTFETLIRREGDVARCPRCGNIDVAKQFSVPAAAHRCRPISLPICGDSQPGQLRLRPPRVRLGIAVRSGSLIRSRIV